MFQKVLHIKSSDLLDFDTILFLWYKNKKEEG
jgi:hypothetical protein